MHVLVSCKYKKDRIKNNQDIIFPIISQWGPYQSFDPICPKTLCSLPPTTMMLHMKFDQDWPTGFRDIQVQKCEIFITKEQITPNWVVWFDQLDQAFSHYKSMGNFKTLKGS